MCPVISKVFRKIGSDKYGWSNNNGHHTAHHHPHIRTRLRHCLHLPWFLRGFLRPVPRHLLLFYLNSPKCKKLISLPFFIEKLAGRTTYRLAEILAEKGWVGEIENLTDLLDAILAAQQHCLGIEDDIVANPFKRTPAAHLC